MCKKWGNKNEHNKFIMVDVELLNYSFFGGGDDDDDDDGPRRRDELIPKKWPANKLDGHGWKYILVQFS